MFYFGKYDILLQSAL